MLGNVAKISQEMKNKSLLVIEKKVIKREAVIFYNWERHFFFFKMMT